VGPAVREREKVRVVFVFLFVISAESLIIARKMQKNPKNAN